MPLIIMIIWPLLSYSLFELKKEFTSLSIFVQIYIMRMVNIRILNEQLSLIEHQIVFK